MRSDSSGHPHITLKGCGKGLKVIIPENIEDELWEELSFTLDQASELIENVDILIDLGERLVDEGFLQTFLSKCLAREGISISSWDSSNETTRELFRKLGFRSSATEKKRIRPTSREETLVIRNSLRSGQRIEHDGDVLVLGHVNDGAEVLASGNIIVCGKLKGLVHGGINSDNDKIIIALSLEAKQVRLGGMVNSQLREDHEWWGKAVILSSNGASLRIKELLV
ncbi:MAG TPA: septum site-determining protein MinC [Synergistales bacterium]|mgnify:CR=1 FL=1|nr:septum site-determining protein MinC [Synergistales bacterium]